MYTIWDALFHTAGKEKEPGTNTALVAGLRYSYLAGVSIHVMACIWYAIARSNEVLHETWIQHTGMWVHLLASAPDTEKLSPDALCLSLVSY